MLKFLSIAFFSIIGIGLSISPVSSSASDDLPAEKKTTTASSTGPTPVPSLQSVPDPKGLHAKLREKLQKAQNDTKKKITTYPKVLTSAQIEKLLGSPHNDTRGSTEAMEISQDLWISIKMGSSALNNIKKAVHKDYVAAHEKNLGHEEGVLFKKQTFQGIQPHDLKVFSDIEARPIEDDRYTGSTVTTQQQKGYDAEGKRVVYKIFISGQPPKPLTYPVEQIEGGFRMIEAILTLSITSIISETKEEKSEEASKAPTLEVSLSAPTLHDAPEGAPKLRRTSAFREGRPHQIPTISVPQNGPRKVRAISAPQEAPPVPPKSSVKEKSNDEQVDAFKKTTPSAPTLLASPQGTRQARSASAPKNPLLAKLKDTQMKTKKTIDTCPDAFIASDILQILNVGYDNIRLSTLPVQIGSLWISAKGVEATFDKLKTIVSDPTVKAHFKDFLQPNYSGQTVKTAKEKGNDAEGTLARYELKSGEQLCQYSSDNGKTLIDAIIELSITYKE